MSNFSRITREIGSGLLTDIPIKILVPILHQHSAPVFWCRILSLYLAPQKHLYSAWLLGFAPDLWCRGMVLYWYQLRNSNVTSPITNLTLYEKQKKSVPQGIKFPVIRSFVSYYLFFYWMVIFTSYRIVDVTPSHHSSSNSLKLTFFPSFQIRSRS